MSVVILAPAGVACQEATHDAIPSIANAERWSKPGLLCIGDAAHAMSLIGALQHIVARLFGMGVRAEHVRSPVG